MVYCARRSLMDVIRETPLMEPMEYCRLYVTRLEPGERGYRAECARVLSQATFDFYSFQTIDRNWGANFEKRPDSAIRLLRIAHAVNALGMRLEEFIPELSALAQEVLKEAPYKKHGNHND